MRRRSTTLEQLTAKEQRLELEAAALKKQRSALARQRQQFARQAQRACYEQAGKLLAEIGFPVDDFAALERLLERLLTALENDYTKPMKERLKPTTPSVPLGLHRQEAE